MKLPKKINPCPIIDSLLEFRFNTKYPADAVFGIVYESLKSKYPNFESLPILQLPEPVRRMDPNLRFKPYYKISNEDYVVQIGADILTISSFPKYLGWEAFQSEIREYINTIKDLSIVDMVLRVGLHVINFFPEIDIFTNAKIQISLSDKILDLKNALFRTEFSHDDNIKSTLHISNNALISSTTGSIIDIDSNFDYNQNLNDDVLLEKISKTHSSEKELFFSLIKDEFLQTLNPEY